MEDTESELAIFCSQARLLVVELVCIWGVMVVQNLWEWPTSDWFNLSHRSQERTHTGYCLNGEEPKAR